MKPPTLDELVRINERLDPARVANGTEMTDPFSDLKRYDFGGEWIAPDELIRRLARRCLELQRFIEDEKP